MSLAGTGRHCESLLSFRAKGLADSSSSYGECHNSSQWENWNLLSGRIFSSFLPSTCLPLRGISAHVAMVCNFVWFHESG